VRFWDTSAVVPLCISEPASVTVKTFLDSDPLIAVWWATRTECVSAFTRQIREGSLSAVGERQAREVLETLVRVWIEVQPGATLRRTAERLLAVHPLRAADALQLAAALQWCRGQTTDQGFVSFDTRLRETAYKEGFTLLPAEPT